MHQDNLFLCVNVEFDDIAVAITVQKLITCMVREGREKRGDFEFKNSLDFISAISR